MKIIAAAGLMMISGVLWAETADLVEEAEAAYLRGEYAVVVQIAERAGEAPLAPDRREALRYVAGMASLQLQQPEEAAQQFRWLLEQVPPGARRAEAEVGMAEATQMAGDLPQAIALYRAVLARVPADHPVVPRAQFQLGQAARAAGLWEAARESLQAVATRFPHSVEAPLAQRLLREEAFAFSVQVGAFGVQANAVRLQRELIRRGYSALVDDTLVDGRAMHRVQVGRFPTRGEANEAASRLRADGFPAKVVP